MSVSRREADIPRRLRDVSWSEDGQARGDAGRDGQQPPEDSHLRGDQEAGRRRGRKAQRRGEDVGHLHARGQVPGAKGDGTERLQKR